MNALAVPITPLVELLNGPLARLLVALVAIGAVILVSRVALSIAWRLVTIAVMIVSVLLVTSMVLP